MNKALLTILAGVGIGILIAPAKGSATRKKLGDSFDKLANDIDRLMGKEDRMLSNAITTIDKGARDTAAEINAAAEGF